MLKHSKRKYKVLIVEDKIPTQLDIKEKVIRLGYSVSGVASTYDQAIASAQQTFPNVALCDISILGHKSGIQVAETLRKMGELVIIYLTVSSSPSIVNDAYKTKPEYYMLKRHLDDIQFFDAQIEANLIQLEQRITEPVSVLANKVMVSESGLKYLIRIDEIIYLRKTPNNGSFIFTNQKNYQFKLEFEKLIGVLLEHKILRLNNDFALNLQYVSKRSDDCKVITPDYTRLQARSREGMEQEFFVSREYIEAVREILE